MRKLHSRHISGCIGRDNMRGLPSRLVLRRRGGSAAAVPERQLLECDRSVGRGQLYRVSSWALVHYSQHRADTMRRRHGDGLGGRRRVR